jgi:hypothetical protein
MGLRHAFVISGPGDPALPVDDTDWNAAHVIDDFLEFPAIATPATPGAGFLRMFARSVSGRLLPAIVGPSGLDTALQPFLARNKVGLFVPIGNSTTIAVVGLSLSATGTANGLNVASTNLHTRMRRIGWLVTTASPTAVVGARHAAAQWTVGGQSAKLGGFHNIWRWGPDTGVANASHRAFVGMRASTAAPTDVNPSTLTNMIGLGYDAADTNMQLMHNDGSGTATKIDLGASFPKPSTDKAHVYEVALFSPPGTTQLVGYEITDLVTDAVATGVITTDLPTTTTFLTPWSMMSVGGVSSVVGIAVMGIYIESDF